MHDCVVVGAGICGLSAARFLATRGKRVLIIEQSHDIGGLCRERHYKGVRYSLYGAHIFHTNDDEVLSFLNQFTHWTYYTHTVKSFCKGKLWTIPMNYSELPEDTEWKRLVLKESLYTDY